MQGRADSCAQCKKCSNTYLALLIPFALAGVLLVTLLFSSTSQQRGLNPKLKAILDSYLAPYKLKHRYWTGLLLLLRCALFLVFAFNVAGDDSVYQFSCHFFNCSWNICGIWIGWDVLKKLAPECSWAFIHSQLRYPCCCYLPCEPVWWKPGCCCIHLSWHSIPDFCSDCQLPHLPAD